MAIKSYKPTTPARRNMTVSAFEGIDKKAKPERSLTETLKKNAGRNSYGRITVRHRGGGNKRKYRIIDFKRDKMDMPATVLRLEYDPNRAPTSRWSSTRMGRSVTSWLPLACRPATRSSPPPRRISSPATACLWQTSPPAPSSTTSSSTPARAASWSVPPAPPHSSWPRRATRPDPYALRRGAHRPPQLQGLHRPGWQHRSREHLHR